MAREKLSKSKVIATAISIADEHGLAAVSLRGIGNRLGVHVTSLYNHVPTKDAVLDGIVRALIDEAGLPAGPIGWQQWVRGFANAMRALGHRHPGAFEAFHHVPAQGTRAGESFEAGFAAFHSAGFDAAATYSAVKSTVVAVIGLVIDDTARARHPGERTDITELPAESFPLIHEIDRIAATTDAFDYLVEALIAGFAANQARGLGS